MIDNLTEPITFDAANKWLAGRVNVQTKMKSKQIALSPDFPPKIKAYSFFSAQVANANILEGLRKFSDSYSRGETDLASAVANAKKFLYGEGYTVNDPLKGTGKGTVSHLASQARLELIFTQNSRMAAAVGENEVAYDPDVLTAFPCFEYMPSTSLNRREEHVKYYGVILPKIDPYWQYHTAPLDFNCNCGRRQVMAQEAEEKGIAKFNPETGKITKPDGTEIDASIDPAGFVFDSWNASGFDCNMSLVKSDDMRQQIFDGMCNFYEQEKHGIDFRCSTGVPFDYPVVSDAKAKAELPSYISSPEKGAALPLGKLSDEAQKRIGLSVNPEIILTQGNGDIGLIHMKKHHAESLPDGSFVKAINETIFSQKDIRTSVHFEKKGIYALFENVVTKSVVYAFAVNRKWETLAIVSAFTKGNIYAQIQRNLKERKKK
jgi:hypothetical protein